MICSNCGYWYKNDDDRYAHCHFEGPDGWAPCEQEEPIYEREDKD